jgi:hypothetical protein
MGGNRIWPFTEWALGIVLEQLERGRAYNPAAVALLRKRLEKNGPIVKPAALLIFDDYSAWVTALQTETKAAGRRAQVALLTAMELPSDIASRIAVALRLMLWDWRWIPYDHQIIEGTESERQRRVA